MKNWSRDAYAALFAQMIIAGNAFAGTDIGAPTSGLFAKMGAFFQEVVDLMEGPFAIAMIVLSMVFAVAVFVWAPRSGALAVALRVVVGAFVIFSIPAWISAFR